MYELKSVSQLGNDITYDIEYKTFFKTYDITIYHDESLNTYDGVTYDGDTYRDIESGVAILIMNELTLQNYKGVN